MIDKTKRRILSLLKKSEKYTKTDMMYFFSGNFWLTIKKVILVGISFILSVGFANLLSPDIYGKYKYIFSIFAILSIPTLPGMSQSIMRAVARGYEGTVVETLKVKILWGSIGSIASIILSAYYYLNANNELAIAFVIVSIFLPFADTFGIFSTILTGKKLFRESILYETLIQSTYAVVMLTTLYLTSDLFVILLTYFISFTLCRFISLRIVVRKHLSNNKIDPGAVTYGKHLSFMSILGTAADSIDNISLWHFFDPRSVAVFAFSKSIPSQIQSMFENITTLAFPKFAKNNIKTIRSTLLNKISITYVFIFIIVIAYIFSAPYVYKIFFPQYIDSVYYSQIYSLILLFFPKKIIGTVFGAHAHVKKLYFYTITSSILKIALAIILIPSYGITGAIMAELGLRAYSLFIMLIMFLRIKPNQ